eukprot:scaffold100326_cov31-Tisochrysis_lutea.AAC.5
MSMSSREPRAKPGRCRGQVSPPKMSISRQNLSPAFAQALVLLQQSGHQRAQSSSPSDWRDQLRFVWGW